MTDGVTDSDVITQAAGLEIPTAAMGRSMVPLVGAPSATTTTTDVVTGAAIAWNASYSQIVTFRNFDIIFDV